MITDKDIAEVMAYFEDAMRDYCSYTSTPWQESHFKLAVDSSDSSIRDAVMVGKRKGITASGEIIKSLLDVNT